MTDNLFRMKGNKERVNYKNVGIRMQADYPNVPFTFVEKFPHLALRYEWVREEDRMLARELLERDIANPDDGAFSHSLFASASPKLTAAQKRRSGEDYSGTPK
jgi:hypothetical protein